MSLFGNYDFRVSDRVEDLGRYVMASAVFLPAGPDPLTDAGTIHGSNGGVVMGTGWLSGLPHLLVVVPKESFELLFPDRAAIGRRVGEVRFALTSAKLLQIFHRGRRRRRPLWVRRLRRVDLRRVADKLLSLDAHQEFGFFWWRHDDFVRFEATLPTNTSHNWIDNVRQAMMHSQSEHVSILYRKGRRDGFTSCTMSGRRCN